MSNLLRPPSVGPIIGHTTSSTARIWIRGADVGDSRTVGIAALYKNNKWIEGQVHYFRLRREYDRTGTVDFTSLQADTPYTVRTASLTVDSTNIDFEVSDDNLFDKLPKEEVWLNDLQQLPESQSVGQFRTFPAQTGGEMRFIFGSCRYPGLLSGKKRSDAIFDAIYQRFKKGVDGASPRFMLMVGDQIYADMFNQLSVGLADTEEEFRERYITAFSSPNMRRLLCSIPHYMILDDHEIEDNWVQERIKRSDKRMLFNIAISAYRSYQWLHSPRNMNNRLYYTFECAGYPFFVTDSRTQRIRDDEDKVLDDNHMLGRPARNAAPGHEGQIDRLCEWLVEQQRAVGNRPKFIVVSSVFVPNNVSSLVKKDGQRMIIKDNRWKDDAWAAFPVTRRQLLQTIVNHQVQNVVFLSGDIHCSNVAEISFEHTNKGVLPLKAFSITSSAFYWPFPFADGEPLDYVHNSREEDDGFPVNEDVTMHYKARDFEQDDNFTEVSIGHEKMVAETFDKKGGTLTKSELKLAP